MSDPHAELADAMLECHAAAAQIRAIEPPDHGEDGVRLANTQLRLMRAAGDGLTAGEEQGFSLAYNAVRDACLDYGTRYKRWEAAHAVETFVRDAEVLRRRAIAEFKGAPGLTMREALHGEAR